MKKYDVKELLKGVIDIHIHAGPSVAERSVDAVEMLRLAEEAGYRAIVIKDHYFPTMLGTSMIQKHETRGNTLIYGGACLNNATGGLNPYTVDTAIAMGAKIIWLPTLSAKRHMEMHKGKFVGAGTLAVEEKPICYLDESGELTPEIMEVLEVMAQHPDVVLASGHGSPRELDKLIPKALEMGIKKILINHPHLIMNASLEDVTRWAEMGAYIEINGAVFEKVTGSLNGPNIPLAVIDGYLERIALDRLVIDSDSGQKGTIDPVRAMGNFFEILLERGVSAAQIETMAKETPAYLLGLS